MKREMVSLAFWAGGLLLLVAVGAYSAAGSPVPSAMGQDTYEVEVAVEGEVDCNEIERILREQGFAVRRVLFAANPSPTVFVELASTEKRDPTAVVRAHDPSKSKRKFVRVFWQVIPEAEPRREVLTLKQGLAPEEIETAIQKLKDKGAVHVELVGD